MITEMRVQREEMSLKKYMKSITAVIMCLLMALAMTACEKTPEYEPVEETLEFGEVYTSRAGITVNIESFAPSDGDGTVLIQAYIGNMTDKTVELADIFTVSVRVTEEKLECEYTNREDYGMTKGISFKGSVEPAAEAMVMDIFKLPGTKYFPLTVTLTFKDTNEQITWATPQ